MGDINKYYKILELAPGATIEEIKQSYKDLINVWHPDKLTNYPRLQQKAENKVKELNEAMHYFRNNPPEISEKGTKSYKQPRTTKTDIRTGKEKKEKSNDNKQGDYFGDADHINNNIVSEDLSEKWFEIADDLYNLRRYHEALKAINKSIKHFPKNRDSWLKKGDILEKL